MAYNPRRNGAGLGPDRLDLMSRIKGLFRLLDLYSHPGLFERIIISQESLGRFINSVLPGAYTNVAKIDFARLDREASLRLVGIYGSKSEIVRFLHSLGSIDDEVAALLLTEDDVYVNTRPSLRSGIYILSPAPPDSSSTPLVRYVVYWPEKTTWNDDATGGVRQNRLMFMRYLTSLTDQIRALISREHEEKLVFKGVRQDKDSKMDSSEMPWNDYDDEDEDDRLFRFEVAITKEEQEAVDVKDGFTVTHHAFRLSTASVSTLRGPPRQETFVPKFVDGEAVQAVATTRFVPGTDHTQNFEESFNLFRFESELRKYGSVVISPSVDVTGFDILLDNGNLKARDRAAYEIYCSAVNQAEQGLPPRRMALAKLEATTTLRNAIEVKLLGEGKQPVLTINDVKPKPGWDRSGEFVLKASHSQSSKPLLETSVWALDLSEDDIQKLKENPSHVPTPRMTRSATKFSLPLDRLQILGQKKALLIVDCPDKIRLWLFSLQTGFSTDRPTCNIPNVPGRQYVVAVDQHTRLVALAMTEPSGNVTLREYLMDETFSTMHSRGSPLSLNTWYTDGTPEFTHASFFNGTEELCLVEVTGRVRVLLIPSRSFRPASVHLHSKPLYVRSSPDGTALIIVEGLPTGTKSIRVFHRTSFGSNENGIMKVLPESFNSTSHFCITSTEKRQSVFLMAFDAAKQRIISAALKISGKSDADYHFQTKGKASGTAEKTTTIHNALIDCFSEVWERFPVAAAIQRQTLSRGGHQARSVTFVSSSASQSFKPYFRRMVQDFERRSRKPTEQRLARIHVTSSSFDKVTGSATSTSQYKAGEWIAELLCLIPIHIAVTAENRFVPIKDGIFDSALERELRGAEVSKIIDAISLGWYESIFSSYMATKPVKVVSSMGDKNVGKSYSLNHMVDSSFAGSAVRTTEGVWLSVCPTKDCLVVALDFEGVHSLERTPQEDMLLVLFNMALSNLVIFRNNFALSRDAAKMFTSFQASTHLFDPAANPRLFKGLLTIVIKDVVDADRRDVVKEFFAEFSQIVSSEQAENFISVLYDGQVTVIPWNVIQSKEFYTLFSKLKNLMFRQRSTHGTARDFLITLKTLMAKMKAQDWGTLDQTIIKHRVATLWDMLPAALECGRSASASDADELRNLDDQCPINSSDSNATFYVGKNEAERQRILTSFLAVQELDPARRGSVHEAATHLNKLATSRIAHVQEWIEKNLSRFPQDHADIRNLKREFEDLVDRLRNAVRLCPAQCATCRPLNQLHQDQAHESQTPQSCTTLCEYGEEHDRPVLCQLPAGHNGRHTCKPAFHPCGESCHLAGRKGCQGRCTKLSDHEEGEHACSAKVHQCGESCDLSNIVSSEKRAFSCSSLCTVPHDKHHDLHVCDNCIACLARYDPFQPERHCAAGGHFYGLDDSLRHQCG